MRRRRTSGWSATGRWTKMAPRISATWGGTGHHRHSLGPHGVCPPPPHTPPPGTLARLDSGQVKPPAHLLVSSWILSCLLCRGQYAQGERATGVWPTGHLLAGLPSACLFLVPELYSLPLFTPKGLGRPSRRVRPGPYVSL